MCHIYLTKVSNMIYLQCNIYATWSIAPKKFYPLMSCIHDTIKKGVAMNRVKDYRTKAGLSQLALSQAIGVARQTINLIENDKYNPSLDLCIKLAQILQTDLNSLFWEGSIAPEPGYNTPSLRERCLPLISHFYLELYKVAKEQPQYHKASQSVNRFLEEAKNNKLEGIAFATRFERFIKGFSLELLADNLTLPEEAKASWDALYDLFQSKEMADTLRLFRLNF